MNKGILDTFKSDPLVQTALSLKCKCGEQLITDAEIRLGVCRDCL